MTELKDRIAALSPDQRAVFEARLAGLVTAPAGSVDDRIPPRDRSKPTPLTFAQQREWALERLRSVNNVGGALRLDGALDLALLGRVLKEIVTRHEVLRSTFEARDRTAVQVVHPVSAVPTPVVDLGDLPPDEQRAEVRRRRDEEMARPFDPSDPLKLRITLLRLAEDCHVALFTTHHAASDAWSLAVLVEEIVALYGLLHSDSGNRLPEPALQCGDFAAWQRERFDERWMAAELEYWRAALDGMPPRLALPADRPHPARPTFAGAHHVTTLSPGVTASVWQSTERERMSVSMLLLATLSVLLYRYTAQDDLVIGSSITGRNRRETERLIGCFANVLPLRMRLSGGLSMREVLRQARDVFVDAFDHQDLPFDRLVEELAPQRGMSQTPLVQVMINVLTAPGETLQTSTTSLDMHGLRVTPESTDPGPVIVDLSLNVQARPDAIHLQWHYNTDLFDPGTVAALAAQFEHVLGQFVDTPDRLVDDVSLLAAPVAAREPVTPARDGDPATVVEMFQRWARSTPDAVAVASDQAVISFGELDRATDRLARLLRSRGVQPDTPVGILLTRSVHLPVAILGVLKAGGAYVVVDPDYPRDRIAYMLADSRAGIVVTNGDTAPRLRGSKVETVLLDAVPASSPEDPAGAEPLPAPAGTSLAYVVYTSGSTGQPKGAMIEHRSLATFAREVAERLELGPDDRFLQFASPSFDVLAEEIFPVWAVGGGVVIPAGQPARGGDEFERVVERHGVTVTELPAAYWHEWVRQLDATDRTPPGSLRLVIVGSERVLPGRLATWQRFGVPLAHVYGISETTVSSTFFRVDPDDDIAGSQLPIGTPLPSADLCVLDRQLRPVPVGAVGELYIGGVSLARGYHGRPGLTAQRFIASADPSTPGARLYRTGDLVRQRADGNFEFLSRADEQIKIRGFRVEPAEIEAALCRHPRVADAIVVAHEPAPGDRRLVAYTVVKRDLTLNSSELRRFVERELPPYLVPSAFVLIDALPLTANGKVDHGRLPAPGAARPELSEGYVAPRTPLEQTLADIVADVIGIDAVGAHDNFFELGGDSILAIQVVARAQDAGVQMSPFDLFERPSVAQLASGLEAAGPAEDAAVPDASADGEFPLARVDRAQVEGLLARIADDRERA